MLHLDLDYAGGMVNLPVDRARSFIEAIIADDEGMRIAVKTRLPLRQFQVWFRDPAAVSLSAAKQFVLRFARPEDIGEPVQLTPQWVVVPIRPEAT